jgi:hypothetical protein
MVMEFACDTAIGSKGHLHGAPLQSQKTAIAEYRRVCGIMSSTVRNPQYLSNLSLRHAESYVVESVLGNGVTGNEEYQKAHNSQQEKCANHKNSRFTLHDD